MVTRRPTPPAAGSRTLALTHGCQSGRPLKLPTRLQTSSAELARLTDNLTSNMGRPSSGREAAARMLALAALTNESLILRPPAGRGVLPRTDPRAERGRRRWAGSGRSGGGSWG